ncbi:hypothetical protein [Streptosporangium sp. NPDC002721]|uniref:hypothetical protein n=1 Tax=Streptosporangium sp. NPDC002721 TaxID=3366188 RepID=UPI00368E4AD1
MKKLLAMAKVAAKNSFTGWTFSHDTSACDSGDHPSVTFWLGDVRSSTEVSEKMKADGWTPVSKKEARPYNADVVLKKYVDKQPLAAAIRDALQTNTKMVEIFFGD